MSGGLVALTLSQYTSWHPWWGPFTVILTAARSRVTVRGIKLSTNAVRAAVAVQAAIMVAICLLVLVDQRAVLSGVPFLWSHLTRWSGPPFRGLPAGPVHVHRMGKRPRAR